MFVFDASTLILIAKSELLDIFLAEVSTKVTIPIEVERECCSAKKTIDSMRIRKALDDARMQAIRVKNRRLVVRLRTDFSLGRGEAEAIALALEEKAEVVGIDDKTGIDACKLLGLAFTTAVGILIRSRQKGSIGKTDALAKLDLLGKYGRYRAAILEDAKMRLEEQK
jgi:predicted nucleic acid-binding protein